MIIELDPKDTSKITIDGIVYIRQEGTKKHDSIAGLKSRIEECFDFSQPLNLWNKLTGDQIFKEIYPDKKNESATSFGVKLSKLGIFEKGRHGKKRYYIVPPVFQL